MEIFVCVLVVIAYFALSLFSSGSNVSSEDKRQLDGLDDGNGGVFVNGEHMTRQEAEDAQSRGELYDTYF